MRRSPYKVMPLDDDIIKFIDSFDFSKAKPVKHEMAFRESPLEMRDHEYTGLVQSYGEYYSKKNKINIILRILYFSFSFGLLFLIICGMIAVSVLICIFVKNNIAIGAGIVTSIGGAVTAILVLPKIIGRYLFPLDEDKYIRDMICKMRNYDEHRIESGNEHKKKQQKNTNRKHG